MFGDDVTTLTKTTDLIVVFLENFFDYFKLFFPLLIIYKVYKRYPNKKNKGDESFWQRFLNLYTFGTGRTDQTDSTLPTQETYEYKNVQIPMENESDDFSGKKIILFTTCFVGLQASFLIWGVMQERIIKYSYENADSKFKSKKDAENFKNSQFLVLSNRFAGLVLSSLIMLIANHHRFVTLGPIKLSIKFVRSIASWQNWAPLFFCSYSSLSNVLSSWFQYESLKYVSFTSQLLTKSSKSVFVMLTGKIVSNKTYKVHEYFSVFLIGVGIFLFSDIATNNLKQTNQIISTTFPGFLCLFGYLVSDSFTSTWQDNLLKSYSMSSISLMFITNLYSCLYTLISLASQGQIGETIEFMKEHADITHHIVLLSVTSAIGQIFIFVTIQKFGALIFSIMMTTRQILSIFLSSIIFQHSMSAQSLIGIFLIFFALFFQQYVKYRQKKQKATQTQKL
ncbi:adenosine 3 -phospho 5 -phosphosulfate transporter 1 [Brachionus plicatilis]|uniref:Adenosine 3'-phospho 5'-phosphosulfate transporter 1 n=1 Tax=Brachionus plicatilis TaxID=10195 RepID=A0A3M7T944_BRAPC|nr:adenosine 3 -phospho 5 -phosphosulfate transporter 1 [Brachionus plicatilis]